MGKPALQVYGPSSNLKTCASTRGIRKSKNKMATNKQKLKEQLIQKHLVEEGTFQTFEIDAKSSVEDGKHGKFDQLHASIVHFAL